MEQKKAKVIEQLKLMQSAAQANLDAGGDFYAMHATCAVEFAKNALALLEVCAAEQEHVEQASESESACRFSVEVKDRKTGEVEKYKNDSFAFLAVNGENGICVRKVKHGGELLKIYILAERLVEDIEKEHPFIVALAKDGERSGDVRVNTVKTESCCK